MSKWILFSLAAVGVVVVLLLRRPGPEPGSQQEARDTHNAEARAKLRALVAEYQAEAMGYYIFVGATKRRLDASRRNQLYEQYGKVLALPMLKLSIVSELASGGADPVSALVKELMAEQGFECNGDAAPETQLMAALRGRAKVRADEILNAAEA